MHCRVESDQWPPAPVPAVCHDQPIREIGYLLLALKGFEWRPQGEVITKLAKLADDDNIANFLIKRVYLLGGRVSHRTLLGSDCSQFITSATPDAKSPQAFWMPDRTAPDSLRAATVRQL